MEMRRGVHLHLSDDAIAGITATCELHGISRTALFEAIGLLLADWHLAGDVELDERSEQLIETARQVDAERRARKP